MAIVSDNVSPDRESFANFARDYAVVPITAGYYIENFSMPMMLQRLQEHAPLYALEGMRAQQEEDRYSFIALAPHAEIAATEGGVDIAFADGRNEHHPGGIFAVLRNLLAKWRAPQSLREKAPVGLFGTLSYEAAREIEDIDAPDNRELGTPVAHFIAPRLFLVFDSVLNTLSVSSVVYLEADTDTTKAYNKAIEELQQFADAVLHSAEAVEPIAMPSKFTPPALPKWTCETSKEEFLAKIATCKDYIFAGDIFQIQVSRRLKIPTKATPLNIYRSMRQINPSPYMFYIRQKDDYLIGASPELLVAVDNQQVTIRPIAGTRKRHSSSRQEREVVQELLNDEKEAAEHVMLVDLARNDVGRVSEHGSVVVDEFRSIEKFSHVIHMTSSVSGTMKRGTSSIDALCSGFPAGTVTGTPRIRAMEIISDMETTQREFYAGGVVLLDFYGNLKSALCIRALLYQDGVAHVQAAAGIVADSIPEHEYAETENKMRACLAAIAIAEARL